MNVFGNHVHDLEPGDEIPHHRRHAPAVTLLFIAGPLFIIAGLFTALLALLPAAVMIGVGALFTGAAAIAARRTLHVPEELR